MKCWVVAGVLTLALAPAYGREVESAATARFSAPRRWALEWAARRPSVVLAASDASGKAQLYAVDLSKQRWTSVTEEPAGKRWGALSPDGESVVFLKDVMGSEIGQLFKVTAKGRKEEPLVPGFPAKSITDAKWGASGKNVYFDASDRSGFGVYQFALGGRRAFTLAFSRHEIAGVLPSGDERYLAYNARSATGDFDVRIVNLATGGEGGTLAVAEGSRETFGTWAPEGATGRLLVNSDASGSIRPGVWDVAASSVTWIDPGLAGDVTALDWYPDGQDILFLQRHEGRTSLWRYSSSSAPARVDGLEGLIAWARVRPDGTVWANLESGERPPDVVAPKAGGTGEPVLPAQGKRKAVSGHAAKPLSFASAAGTPLSGWLTVPSGAPGAGARAAVVWLTEMPGSQPADEWDPVRLGLADDGLLVLALGYRAGAEGLEDIAGARDWLVREHGVLASSVAIAGRFYGGTLALLALGRQPDLWAAGASVGGVADWTRLYEDGAEPTRALCRRLLGADPETSAERYAEASPASYAFTIRAPVLLLHASSDSRAPLPQMEAFASRLKDAGKAHRLSIVKGGQAGSSAEDQGRFLDDLRNLLHQAGFASR